MLVAHVNGIDIDVTSEASTGCETAGEAGPRQTPEDRQRKLNVKINFCEICKNDFFFFDLVKLIFYVNFSSPGDKKISEVTKKSKKKLWVREIFSSALCSEIYWTELFD